MKSIIFPLLLVANFCMAQTWQASIMAGAANYTGDLNKKSIVVKSTRPVVSAELRYDMYNVVIRGGVSYAMLTADDNNNKGELNQRNLNFKTNVVEGHLGVELNVLEPDYWASYPYIFAGVGYFHFNPYTFDKNNKKVYLQPIGTEGQGFAEYPDRKPYKLWEFAIPFGGGFKFKLGGKSTLAYEFGYRVTFTDYIDDVSKRFIDPHIMLSERGQSAVDIAYRVKPTPVGEFEYDKVNNSIRGNPKVKDGYFFNGLKLIFDIGGSRED